MRHRRVVDKAIRMVIVAATSVGALGICPASASSAPLSEALGTTVGSTASPRATDVAVNPTAPFGVPQGAALPMLTFDGHGNGHGIGLSQYGALGYAIDRGFDAAQILDRYYGGTVAATADTGVLSVALKALDGQQTAVVQPSGQMIVVGDPAAQLWRSVVARETAEGVFRVWGRTDGENCPDPAANLDDPALGWVVVMDSVATVTMATAADVVASTNLNDLLAVCEPGGVVRSYRGLIRTANDTQAVNHTVNDVPMEQYLRAVVPSEMPSSWAALGGGKGLQALLAQAVAARSYAAVQNRAAYAKTCDTQACQVYAGAGKRPSLAAAMVANERPESDAAVAATAGQVRRTGSAAGPISSTMFSSSSGGWTAPTDSPGFAAVADEGDSVSINPYHNWSVQIPVSTIEQAWPAIGRLIDFTVTKRNGLGDQGGRVITAVIRGTAATVTVTGDEVRQKLSLRSNWFAFRSACLGRDAPPAGTPMGRLGGLGFTGITPTRVVDTRTGFGTSPTPLLAGCTMVVNFPTAPADAQAVALTLTTTRATAGGFTTAYPCGTSLPNVSAVQILPGADVPGTTIVPFGPAGGVCIYSSVTTDLVVDVLGWYGPSGAGLRSQVPERLFDSRRPLGSPVLPAGTITRVQVVNDQRPVDAVAASVNITATESPVGGYVTAFPCGSAQPLASVVNFRRSIDVANHAFVALDAMGGFCLFNSAPTHLIVDIDGWYASSKGLTAALAPPARLVDSRSNVGTSGPWTPGETRSVDFGATSDSVIFELSAIDAASAGYLTIYPCSAPPPNASVVNASPGTNVANLVMVQTDAQGRVCIYSSMATQVLIDVVGRT